MASESIPIDQPPVPTAPAVAIGENDAVFVAPPPTFPEKPQPDAPPRPAPRPTTLIVCLVILTVIAVGAVLTTLRPIITPVLIAVFLFFLVNPFIAFCERRGIATWLAYVLIVFLMVMATYLLVLVFDNQGDALRARLPKYEAKIRATLDSNAKMLGMANEEGKFDWDRYGIRDLLPFSQEEFFTHVVGVTLETVEIASMAVFYLLFMLFEARLLPRRARHSLQPETAERVLGIADSINADIWRYLVVKTAVSAGLGATTAAIGMMFGLDFWLLWGLLMFLGNYVTYVGSIVALGPPILIALVQYDSPWMIGAVIGLQILSRVFWIDYVEIRYSGKHVNVSPLLLLFGLALMGWMWGFVGMLLAVPLITSVRIALGSHAQTEYLARLMADVE